MIDITDRKPALRRYMLQYIESIPLDDVPEMKDMVDMLPDDCKLQNIGSDNTAHFVCQDVVVARNVERAKTSVELNFPEIPPSRRTLHDFRTGRVMVSPKEW